MTPSSAPAFRALLDACRRWLGLGAHPEAPAEVDWRQAGRLGFFHNLDPLLYRLVEQRLLPASEIPSIVLATWESAHYRNFLFNSRAIEILERLAGEARRASTAFVVFKGPATLARAYGDPALRIMVDLDLLLLRQDLETLSRITNRLGFIASGRDHLLHTVTRNPELDLDLELHFDIYDFLLRRGELVERAVTERVELQLDGRLFPAAPPELALVLDVAHLVNDDFKVDLRRWLDLAALLSQARGTVDWQGLHAALRDHGVLPEFLLAVEVTSELFALGPETVPFFRASGYSEQSRARVIEQVARLDRGSRRPALQELAYRSGVGAKISYLRRRLLPTGSRLRALAPAGQGTGAALMALHRQAMQTAARELSRWRSAGVAGGAGSIKAAVYERNLGAGEK